MEQKSLTTAEECGGSSNIILIDMSAQVQPPINVDDVEQMCAANPVAPNGARVSGTLDLQNRDFRGRDFSNRDLRDCSLRGALLADCNFGGADLTGCDLSEADLRGADLKRARGLEAWQFRATDIRDVKLPKELAEWKGLDIVAKHATILSKQFLVLLGACLYCWLVVATTTDVALILNSGTQALPIIQTRISIVLFYGVAPFLIATAFLYYQLNMQRMWEALAKLPAIFADGRRLDEHAYPWSLIQKVRMHYPRLRGARDFGFVPQSEIRLGSAVAYLTAPVTLALFWLRSLMKHSDLLTLWIALLTAASLLIAVQFSHYAASTLEGELPDPGQDRLRLFTRETRRRWILLLASVVILCLGSHYKYEIPALLFGTELSTKPEGWAEDQADIAKVKGAELLFADLRNATLSGAFLVKARLAFADLRGADLTLADLRGADLSDAQLGGANLTVANLHGADLSNARGLTRQQLEHALIDRKTRLQSEFQDLVPK